MKKIKKKHYILLSVFVLILSFYFSLPKPLFKQPTAWILNDRNGELLSAKIAEDGQWRFPPADSIPEKFTKCIIEFEDKRFYYHLGIDPIALARAIRQNIKQQKIVSGASTLSMQVIRLSRNKDRNLFQKLWETILAFRLELTYSKASILKLYANNAPFGGNVVGLDAAAWRYFGRAAKDLSWAESATLAVLPNTPSLIHLGRNRSKLLQKRNQLLNKLVTNGIITAETGKLAQLEPLPTNPIALPQQADHLLTYFQKKSSTTPPITRLNSTLSPSLQKQVLEILQRYQQKHSANGIYNSAALVLHIPSNEVLAYQGNVTDQNDQNNEQYVDIIQSLRSPGSTLKPLLYAAMLHDGQILPKTLIADIPTQIAGYTPQNYDLEYNGAVPADKSLSRSLNIPAVKMLQNYKYQRFYHVLKDLGFTSLKKNPDHYGLSMILGGAEVSMWELSNVYSNLARYLSDSQVKNEHKFHFIKTKFSKDQQHNEIQSKNASRNLDPASVYFTFQAMQEVMRPGEEGLWEQFDSSQKIAWKTGTSFGFKDAWAIGMNSEFVVCVWVGNADGEGRPNLTGVESAAPALFEIFSNLPNPKKNWETPLDWMIQTGVCRESGHLAGKDCPQIDTLYVPATGFKSPVCPYHQIVHLDKNQEFRVTNLCYDQNLMVTKNWFVLPPAMAHFYKKKNSFYQELPPFHPNCASESDEQLMEIVYPKNHAKIYLPLTHQGLRSEAIFTVAHQISNVKIFWHINSEYIGVTESSHQMAIKLDPGKYKLTLVDEMGNRLVQNFEILKHNHGKKE